MTDWQIQDIHSQHGKRVVITGATGGLGYETALVLAGKGAEVILTGRNAGKGQAALDAIRAVYPNAQIRYDHLDLSSLDSIRDFTTRFAQAHDSLDILINNAGVMTPPTRQTTVDGFELQMGTNYLSHFSLTAQLLPLLRKVIAPRVVNLSSNAHKLMANIHFDDLQWQQRYKPWPAYAQSKLAMLMFALELQRRSDAGGWRLMSNAAHPGYARTNLIANGPGTDNLTTKLGLLLQPIMSHSAADGALPTLYAATAPDAQNAAYYGPKDCFELKGPVAAAAISRRAQNTAIAARLWQVSEALTGAVWPNV
ncbi:oxidoreductase [Aquirhabdus sp.]|uniref:oxidoreductase n=1 Tax=Aquirhabdus sp. TaxID=2824160 RepID=UPI00396CEE93